MQIVIPTCLVGAPDALSSASLHSELDPVKLHAPFLLFKDF